MGTWDIGPFDNDAAADWCSALDNADPTRREQLLREVFLSVIEQPGYLGYDAAAKAIAAAMIVAAHLPAGPRITSPYAPDFLVSGERIAIGKDLPALAVQALDRAVSEESEWQDLWLDSDNFDEAVEEVDGIRSLLGG